MYIVTNRQIDMSRRGLKVFASTPNEMGPNELRIVRLVKVSGKTRVKLLEDELSESSVKKLSKKYGLELDLRLPWYASFQVACDIFALARRERKHVLFYVHGYNNDIADIIDTAKELERLYNVLVVPFSWPANGGGALSGTAAYLDDKQDARTSANALNSFIRKIAYYHDMLTSRRRTEYMEKASKRYPDNPALAREYFIKLQERDCKTSLNLLCHSMGNYLFKYALQPEDSALAKLVFDNVALVAADANNRHHVRWLGRVQVKNRVYVVINERDSALKWSRRKPGKEQRARLGHYLKGLVAENATYLNLTGARGVGDSHSYFKGKSVASNIRLARLFRNIFEGKVAENTLEYRADINAYQLK